jgi:hypothetical protein
MQNTSLTVPDMLLGIMPAVVLITAFGVAVIANAVDIIYCFNGLASGTVAIMLGVIVAVAIGFVSVSWPFGKLFLSNGGAYLLSFPAGWVATLLPMRHPQLNAWATMLLCAYMVLKVMF